jgi:hypothetical protein
VASTRRDNFLLAAWIIRNQAQALAGIFIKDCVMGEAGLRGDYFADRSTVGAATLGYKEAEV